LIENLAYETYKFFFWIPWLKIEAFFGENLWVCCDFEV
jgi:hypothetical protein